MGGLWPSAFARQEIVEFWRLKLEEAHERYEIASAGYRRLLGERPEGPMHRQDETLAQARDAVSDTLLEYSRRLRIFTQLTLTGTMPHEQEAGGNGDER